MINIYINSKIYIKLKDVPQELRLKIMKEYRFKYFTFRGKQKEENTINLMEVKELKGNKWVCLPPNLTYLLNVLKTSDVNFQVIDNRVKPKIENFPDVLIEFRGEQESWINKMKAFDYNCILSASTGGGKTLCSVKLASILKTPMLFVASKTSYLKSFSKEVNTFVENPEQNLTEVNTEWLRNGAKITPYMVASIQALNNKKILEALENKIGILVGDELHLGLTSEVSRSTLFSLNPRYRLFLSATPNVKVEGYVQACLTPNTISSEVKIDYPIYFQRVITDLGFSQQRKYKSLENYHEKKEFIYKQPQLLFSSKEFIKWLNDNDRGVLVYCTDQTFQENLAKELNKENINTVCFNSKSNKSKYEEYFKDFDSGKIRVIVGGVAVVESLSLYRLSVVLDLDLSSTENGFQQLIGRLRRRDTNISDKDKVYIKLMFKGMNESKFTYVIKPTINNYMKDYVKILEPKISKDFELLDIFV